MQQNALPIVIHACPSIRLKNGISYSSRFKNFSTHEKKILDNAAKFIYEHLIELKHNATSITKPRKIVETHAHTIQTQFEQATM